MPTYHAQLVGVNFRPAEAKEAVKRLEVGNILALEREPENEHDSNAIKVLIPYFGENLTFLGYIERGVASVIAPQLDEGYTFRVTVNTRLSPLSVLLTLEPEEAE